MYGTSVEPSWLNCICGIGDTQMPGIGRQGDSTPVALALAVVPFGPIT